MQSRRNGDYWRERFRKMEEAQKERSIEKAREIQEQFDRTLSELDKKINVWYKRLADNNDVSLAEAKRMLDKKELREFRWSVEEYIKYGKENDETGQWVKELENASSRVHIGWLEARKMEIRAAAEKLYGKFAGTAGEHIRDTYADNYYRTAYEIRKKAGIDVNIQALDENMVEKIISNPWAVDGKNFSERIWQDKRKLINTMHQSLTRMCITGAPPDAAVSEIAKAMNVSKKRAWTLVMTETAAFSNKARQECMNDLNVEEYEVVETLDDCTCRSCGEMDGKHYRMDEFEIGVTAPPFHPNCRGCTAPYFNDKFTAGEKRAARDEEGNTYYVPSDMTYEEWKKTFVEGGKSGLQETGPDDTIIIKKLCDGSHHPVRTQDQFENVTEKIKKDISIYSSNPSKWSGTVNVMNVFDDNVRGVKEWSCDISVLEDADDGTLWHEMLHSCSTSYYDPATYTAHQYIEEASVEFLTQQICLERNITNVPAYEDKVFVLRILNDVFHYGTDLEFAKELFNKPLPERYEWLECLVYDSLVKENVSAKDFDEVMNFVRTLKGGLYGNN